jgi:hypothetical protein
VTSGFGWFGQMVILSASSGDLESLFFAQATGTDGLWALVWNSTATDDVPLTLKNTPPSTA